MKKALQDQAFEEAVRNRTLTPQVIWTSEKPPSVYDMKVYLIRCQHTKRVKIGIAVNPAKRLHDMQLMCPTELELVCTAEGGRRYERELHERFALQRLHGEWFALSREQVEALAREFAKAPPLSDRKER